MAKKKSVRRKSSRKISEKRASNPSSQKIYVSERKVQKTWRALLYSAIVFVISLVLYLVTTGFLASIFGFIMIISGALVLLFIILEIIYYFMKRK